MIGKDITRFHAVYWPAFLMSAGIALPKRIFSHGFLNNKGVKMSKSDGNVVDPFTMSEQYGVDAMRYFFLREVPFGQDGSYSHEAIVNRTNADLANNIGNLTNRSLTIMAKNCGGVFPEPAEFSEQDETLLAAADALLETAREAMERQALHRVLEAALAVGSEANKYFTSEQPWALKKTDPARMGTVLYVTAEVLRQIAILMQPFIPASAEKLLDQLGVAGNARGFAQLGSEHRLKPGTALGALAPVFPRYVEPENAAAE
jgi:methionyl-tRNA synthetase